MNTPVLNERLNITLGFLPISIGVIVFLFFRTPLSILVGAVAMFAASELCAWTRAWLRGRLAYRLWSSYLNPGYTGPAKFSLTQEIGRRIIDAHEIGMGGPESKDVLLEDGAIIYGVRSGWIVSANRRFIASDTYSGEFVIYDQQEHVTYHYHSDDDQNQFSKLPLYWGHYAPPGKFDAILNNATREQLVFYRGVWLPPSHHPELHPSKLERHFANGLKLEAVLECPDDLRMAENPLKFLRYPHYRIWLNGEPANLICSGLNEVCASPEGDCLIVSGIVVDEVMNEIGNRWYVWQKGRGWTSIERCVQSISGDRLGWLGAVKAVSHGTAVFRCELSESHKRAFVQTAWQLLPQKLNINNEVASVMLP